MRTRLILLAAASFLFIARSATTAFPAGIAVSSSKDSATAASCAAFSQALVWQKVEANGAAPPARSDAALVNQIKALTKVDQVGVPVFVQLGDFDVLFPALLAEDEAQFYSGAPGVTVDTLSDIGHSFNLHTNHQAGWDHIAAWIGSTLGN